MGKKKVRMPADIKRDARLWNWLSKQDFDLPDLKSTQRKIFDYVTRYYK